MLKVGNFRILSSLVRTVTTTSGSEASAAVLRRPRLDDHMREPTWPHVVTSIPGPKSIEMKKRLADVQVGFTIEWVGNYEKSFGKYVSAVWYTKLTCTLNVPSIP
jgi:hypothetical protein